jgi:hypothetical protein
LGKVLERIDVSLLVDPRVYPSCCLRKFCVYIYRVLPIIFSFYCIGKISLLCSLLKAVTEVDSNLHIICKSLLCGLVVADVTNA